MTRSNLFTTCVASVVLAVIAGCASSSPEPPDTGAPTAQQQLPGNGSGDAKKDETAPKDSATGKTDDAKTDPKKTDPKTDPKKTDPKDPAGEEGGGDRRAVNQHCCFNGTYLKCPNAEACFGGVDVNACIRDCNFGDVECVNECVGKLDTAGPPKGCDANATPPAAFNCGGN